MTRKILIFLSCIIALQCSANANTECSSRIFSTALTQHINEINENAPESAVRAWAHTTITSGEVLEKILECPEIKSLGDYETINFDPLIYTFPNGRTITINYATQPKILKQKLLLSKKPSIPNGVPNPKLMDENDPAKYLNTEPAWYAIMVVQHDALKDFVGPDKNNTLSIQYINDHIDEIYPRGAFCTNKSAIALNKATINRVVHDVVDMGEDDSNDYYVAGDVNLEWVMYAEIAADIAIAVMTMGGGTVAMGAAKSARAGRIAKNMKNLFKDEHVLEYVRLTQKIKQQENTAKKIEEAGKLYRNLNQEYRAALSAGKTKEADELLYKIADISNEMKKLNDPSISVVQTLASEEKTTQTLERIAKEIEQLNDQAETLSKSHDSINAYQKAVKELGDFNKYRHALNAVRRPQTGNIITRNLKKIIPGIKSLRAAGNGAKTLTRAGRAARAGMSSRSARIGDWLFDATLKHGARLARFERDAGALYTVAEFALELYDKTSSVSQEFSNGIEFKPLCLLSADDLDGQENVVNYGMWLMWVGNSTDAADDDAAYLQAMDFATKFYYQLDKYQDENGANCNVDIYVVRPIIRLDETNVENPSGEMFYLFMNEIPWTTANQFE